jgi:CBS domain-containing protein
MDQKTSPVSTPDLRRLTAQNIMTASPLTVEPGTKLSKVAQLMDQQNIQHFPVIDGDRLVNLLGERHLRDAIPSMLTVGDPKARRQYLNVTQMEQITPKNVPTVKLETPLAEIIAIMRKHRLDGVSVAQDNRLAGIVTRET